MYSTGFSFHWLNSCWVISIRGREISNKIVFMWSWMYWRVCLCLIQIWTNLSEWNRVLVPTNLVPLSFKILRWTCNNGWTAVYCRKFWNISSSLLLGVTCFAPYLFSIKWAVSLLVFGYFYSYLDIRLKLHSETTPLSFQPWLLFNCWIIYVSSVGVSNYGPRSQLRMFVKKLSQMLNLSGCLKK